MKWKIFSRKEPRKAWRLLFKPDGDAADLMALPGAVIEGRIAGRYLLASSSIEGTVIIHGVGRKSILAGADVTVDYAAATRAGVDVARQPRGGRAALRPADTVGLEELMLGASDEFVSAPAEADELVCLLYTSGTTGKPKGVQLTARNLQHQQRAARQVLTITEEDRLIGVLPFFHVFGLANVLFLALTAGARIVLIAQYSPAGLLKAIIEDHPTLLIAIPTMYAHLAKLLTRKQGPVFRSLRLCVSGAASLPGHVLEAFEKATGCRLIEGYGLTETTSACCLNPPAGESKAGSIGKPMPGFEMKVVDEAGTDLPPEQVGEIVVKGQGVTPGYYNLPEDNASAFRDGWLLTGDLGYQDREGYFFITDRKKEIVIKGGLNISPREVEETLCRHPLVKEAAVIGRRKGDREEVVAYVTTSGEVTAKEIQSHCRAFLSAFKVPDVVEFRESLPMSVTGKVLKKALVGERDDRRIERDDGGQSGPER